MRRRLDRPFFVDAALAAVLIVLAEVHVWSGASSGSTAVTALAGLVIAGSVAWRRRAPLAAVVTAMTAVAVQTVLASSPQALWVIVTWIVLFYSAGAALPRGRAYGALAIGLVGAAIDEAGAADRSVQGFVFGLALVAVPWLAGRAVHRREGRAEALELRSALLERDREEATRSAVRDERARIARDLHDMVAHAVSLMVLNAEAADALLDSEPARTRDQLVSIQRTGRQALAEMTRLLGMLREGERRELAPQPRAAELGSLVDEVRAAGLPVSLEIDGEGRPLQPGVDLTVYRIVQEALTNTLKHGGRSASAKVMISFGTEAVTIDVRDDGDGATHVNGGGHGLIGMRERVALYGGSVQAEPRPTGGFSVRAVLPLEPAGR
jgi:signal transduction histidine kinase